MSMKALILRQYPDESFPKNMDFFSIVNKPIPTKLEDGQILVKVFYVSIDPVMRVWLSGAKTYIDKINIGQTMPAFGIGVCIASKAQKWNIGELVFGVLEVADYSIRDPKKVYKVPQTMKDDPSILPLVFSVYGVTGITALQSMKQIPESNRPSEGKKKTFVVSSAAGSTGSYAIQIAKHWGYRSIGIVSSQDKKQFIMSLGADECICYNDAKENGEINTDKLTHIIKKVIPEGIDAFFDNAGEEVLDSVLPCMAQDGYITLCGATATYNSWKQRGGLKNLGFMISKRIKAEGIMFYGEKKSKMFKTFFEMVNLVNDGHVKHHEEILDGIETFVSGLQRLFLGQNLGKVVIKIDNQILMPKY